MNYIIWIVKPIFVSSLYFLAMWWVLDINLYRNEIEERTGIKGAFRKKIQSDFYKIPILTQRLWKEE